MADNNESEIVYPCKICRRNFIQTSLEKHEPACEKLQTIHRKVFDSGKQRATGSDVPLIDIRKAQKEKEKHGGIFPRPKTNWRERHEELIISVSASKDVKEALKTGGPLPPPPRTSIPSDYTRCKHCNRTFNERALERHVTFCKEQHLRNINKFTVAPHVSSTTRSATLPSHKSNYHHGPAKSINATPHAVNHEKANVLANVSNYSTSSATTPNRSSLRSRPLLNAAEPKKNSSRHRSSSQSRTTCKSFTNVDSVPYNHQSKAQVLLENKTANVKTKRVPPALQSIATRSSSQSRLKTPKQVTGNRQ